MAAARQPEMTPDELRRAGAGDRPARQRLVQRYAPVVWSSCLRLDPEPEDATQEAWEKVLRGLHRYDPAAGASISTWISVVTHRVLVDRHRRRASSRSLTAPESVASPPTQERAVQRSEQLAEVERAMAQLPRDQRRAVLLFHLRGLSLDQIAEGEGVAVGTVKSRLSRGRTRLATMLGGAR